MEENMDNDMETAGLGIHDCSSGVSNGKEKAQLNGHQYILGVTYDHIITLSISP